MFEQIERNDFRVVFQPARVMLVTVLDKKNKRTNFFPVAFNMYCGYKPLSFAFAVHDINYSYKLLEECEYFTLAVPGEKLAGVVLESGMVSGESIDKFEKFGLEKFIVPESDCCGIKECIANIFCKKTLFTKVSDHAIVCGEAVAVYRDFQNNERNVLTIGEDHKSYTLLQQRGIHYIGVKNYTEE